MNISPIKRHEFLKPFSRDHHHGLLLCWKIKTGFSKNVEASRIRKYTVWLFDNSLLPHFEMEEKYLFPILGKDNDLIKRAIAEHGEIKRLVQLETELQKNLNSIKEILENHIRFEERILFNAIQSVATTEQLQQIQFHHSDTAFADNLTDAFWE